MIARVVRRIHSRRRPPTPEEAAARAEEERAAAELETTRTLARSPMRDFTSDRGPRR